MVDDILERFLQMLNESGMTLAEISRKSCVPATSIQHYKKGHLPGLQNLRDICEVCNTSADWILGFSEDKELVPTKKEKTKDVWRYDV